MTLNISPNGAPSFKLPDTPDNRAKLIKLASTLRELFKLDEYKHSAHYAGLISELMDARDAVAKHPVGSAEHRRLWGLATPLYNAARNYAAKYKLDPPNVVLQACGYSV